MHEKNKNKRRFYKDFKDSIRFYCVIIPYHSAYESSGARRKYSTYNESRSIGSSILNLKHAQRLDFSHFFCRLLHVCLNVRMCSLKLPTLKYGSSSSASQNSVLYCRITISRNSFICIYHNHTSFS